MATMTIPEIEIHNAGLDLAQKAVCIKVRLQRLGNTRKNQHLASRGGHGQGPHSCEQAFDRFGGAATDYQLRRRSPAVPVQHVSTV